MKKTLRGLVILLGAVACTALAADEIDLYFVAPADGAVVVGPVRVVFGLRGMGVAPAGVQRPGTGHHHLLINAPLPAAGLPIPADAQYVHFGGGQTETVLELEPGVYTLQLLLGDHNHIPHDPVVVSKQVTITVME